MSLWDSLSEKVGSFTFDDFAVLADKTIEYERAKNTRPDVAAREQLLVATTPTTTAQNPNIQPISADDIRRSQQVGAAQPLAGGLFDGVNKKYLIAGGAFIAGVILLKMVK